MQHNAAMPNFRECSVHSATNWEASVLVLRRGTECCHEVLVEGCGRMTLPWEEQKQVEADQSAQVPRIR